MKAQRTSNEKLRAETKVIVDRDLPSDFDHCVLPRGYFDRFMTSIDAPHRRVLSVESWPFPPIASARDTISK